jgi:hypothetical protein
MTADLSSFFEPISFKTRTMLCAFDYGKNIVSARLLFSAFDSTVVFVRDCEIPSEVSARLARNEKEKSNSYSEIKIYPNPAIDYVTVFIPHNNLETTIELIDISGRKLQTHFFTGLESNIISVYGLASGVYVLKIVNNNESMRRRITIRH